MLRDEAIKSREAYSFKLTYSRPNKPLADNIKRLVLIAAAALPYIFVVSVWLVVI